jgi:hypothetical protein
MITSSVRFHPSYRNEALVVPLIALMALTMARVLFRTNGRINLALVYPHREFPDAIVKHGTNRGYAA